jgi:hypothetical protein
MRKPKPNNEVFVNNIDVNIYNTWLNVYYGQTIYECLYFVDKTIDIVEGNWIGTDGVFWINTKHNRWFMAFNVNKISYGTIAHECFHATHAILKRKGIIYSDETEEAYAYLLDFLVTKTIGILKEYL